MKLLKKLLKGALIILGVWAIAGFGLIYYGLSGAADRVKPLCESIKTGTSLEDLRPFAKENGFLYPEGQSTQEVTFLAERRSAGRYGCKLTLEQGAVKSASIYHFD